jgi:hypothetical protein
MSRLDTLLVQQVVSILDRLGYPVLFLLVKLTFIFTVFQDFDYWTIAYLLEVIYPLTYLDRVRLGQVLHRSDKILSALTYIMYLVCDWAEQSIDDVLSHGVYPFVKLPIHIEYLWWIGV